MVLADDFGVKQAAHYMNGLNYITKALYSVGRIYTEPFVMKSAHAYA
ncbi:hypothetical protein ACFQZT_19205 [Paenibacillus sp. GCM10027628]